MADPRQILQHDRARVDELARKVGRDRARALLERAAKDLEQRLKKLRPAGGGEATYTETHLRLTLAQVKASLAPLQAGLGGVVKGLGKQAAALTARATVDYAKAAEARFRGVAQPLPIREAAVLEAGADAGEQSVVRRIAGDPEHRGRPGVLERYGSAVMGNIERELQLRFLGKRTWAETVDAVREASPFLKGAPASWAERLVRTEVMNASNAAAHAGIKALDEELGDACKILCATFDDRTAADSYAVHGQIRRPSERFDTWQDKVMHPPARPNDRESVVPHRVSWPIPPELQPRSAGEVASRWRREGHKRGMPPIPKHSTIPLELFGKVQPKKKGEVPGPAAPRAPHALGPEALAPRPAPLPAPHPIVHQEEPMGNVGSDS